MTASSKTHEASHRILLNCYSCYVRGRWKEVTSSIRSIPESRGRFAHLDSQSQMAEALLELELVISWRQGECFSVVPLKSPKTSFLNRSVLLRMAWMNHLYWTHSLRSLVDEMKGSASFRVMAVTGKALVWKDSRANICDAQFINKVMELCSDGATPPNSTQYIQVPVL